MLFYNKNLELFDIAVKLAKGAGTTVLVMTAIAACAVAKNVLEEETEEE